MNYYIGADLGTSALKLFLTDENAQIIKSAVRTYPIIYPRSSWSEQNPSDWWDAFVDGMIELIENTDTSKIRGIGIGGQMHGLVILDKYDNVIRPAILWNDGRCDKETDFLNKEIGIYKLLEYTGNMAFSGFTAPKL